MSKEVDLLGRAFQATERIVTNVKPEQMSNTTPCSEWDVRAQLNHTVGVMHMIATCAAGGPVPAFDPSAPPAEVIGNDAAGAFRQAADAALTAWSREGVLEGKVTLPPGEMPGRVAIGINLFDTYTHAWDIAKATGQDTALDPELAAAAHDAAKMVIQPQFRQPGGPFAPDVSVPGDASAGDQLIAFSGRQP